MSPMSSGEVYLLEMLDNLEKKVSELYPKLEVAEDKSGGILEGQGYLSMFLISHKGKENKVGSRDLV